METETRIINLDFAAATHAQAALQGVSNKKTADLMDTVATNALGVLLEMGVYGCFLFLLSRPDRHKTQAQAIHGELVKLLGKLPGGPQDAQQAGALTAQSNARDVLDYVTEHVTGDLDRVLLTRQVFEQMLLYVRYGAAALKPPKAKGGAKEGKTT